MLSGSETFSGSPASSGSKESRSFAEILAESYPPLAKYCPILPSISPQQALFLSLNDVQELFYGGAVGGGKTAALLMGALQYADVPGYAALILRRTFPELEQPGNVIPMSQEWFATVPEHERPRYNSTDHEWSFASGARLRFGHLQDANSLIRYQGGGYHYVGFDELTHFEEQSYDFLAYSRQRRPAAGPLSRVPIRVRATANPGGPGHIWVKRRFITDRDPSVVFIPAKVWDNPGIDTDDYVGRLEKLSPAMKRQLLDGDWGAFEDAAYPMFSEDVHVVPSFDLPDEWERFESMDYGAANPTAWGLHATDYDGNLIVSDLYYSPGLVVEHAKAILELRAARWERKGSDGWIERNRCYSDPSIRNKSGLSDRFGRALSVEQEFVDHGIFLVPANNNREAGFNRIRELLNPDEERPFPHWHPRRGERGSPRLFVMRHCGELIEQLAAAPLEEAGRRLGGKAVDGKWESAHGHAHAMLRYGVMSRPGASFEPEKVAETEQELREERARHALERRYRDPEYVDI